MARSRALIWTRGDRGSRELRTGCLSSSLYHGVSHHFSSLRVETCSE